MFAHLLMYTIYLNVQIYHASAEGVSAAICRLNVVGAAHMEHASTQNYTHLAVFPEANVTASCAEGSSAVQIFTGTGLLPTGPLALDDSLPGATLLIKQQSVTLRDSLFANLSLNGAAPLSILSSNVSLINCTFINNSAPLAGAIHITNSTVSIYNSSFLDNASSQAGAIQALGTTDLRIIGTSFGRNRGSQGGAVYSRKIPGFGLLASTFEANRAADGGAVFLDSVGSARIEDSLFTRNVANNSGAAIAQLDSKTQIWGSVFHINTAQAGTISAASGQVVVERCNFTLNSSPQAGSLHLRQVVSSIGGSVFAGNSGLDGAAISQHQCSGNITFCTFEQNTARGKGGAVYRSTPNGTADIVSCIFDRNSAAEGGAVWEQVIRSGSVAASLFDGNAARRGAAIYSRVSRTLLASSNRGLTPGDVYRTDS